jgi:hypothetical protein
MVFVDLVIVGKIVFRRPERLPVITHKGKAVLRAGDLIQCAAAVFPEPSGYYVHTHLAAELQSFGKVDIEIHVTQQILRIHNEFAIGKNVHGV